jgi:hypothetical protein
MENMQNDDFNVLYWRKSHCSEFPVLAKVARFILSIPASSAESERVFSASSNTETEKRSRLLPANVNALLVIKSNTRLIK